MANPLIPAAYDLWWSGAVVLVLVALIAALVSISRTRNSVSPSHALVWTLLAIFVPIIGPASWFLIGRRANVGSGAGDGVS
ncbi:hypothetical protein FHX49_001694 [Microbacterium endophyticum]|uniref:Cardiolipin synthase N-terminal domain-containing protein n=1 Tax=Microbacterium endophyticum TaxID=1526412 RepID=A0A7W4V3N6_9MICO|nr:PLD nuclease N-terminal domain-containing protein [Microbacterium endophyticum]MBB2976124.1 hypothetical protein [Microbacterium endophyticum]NIK36421.1 hypothetical protein [Microbacterium endophyticum]